jgi:hypothetical protein
VGFLFAPARTGATLETTRPPAALARRRGLAAAVTPGGFKLGVERLGGPNY